MLDGQQGRPLAAHFVHVKTVRRIGLQLQADWAGQELIPEALATHLHFSAVGCTCWKYYPFIYHKVAASGMVTHLWWYPQLPSVLIFWKSYAYVCAASAGLPSITAKSSSDVFSSYQGYFKSEQFACDIAIMSIVHIIIIYHILDRL